MDYKIGLQHHGILGQLYSTWSRSFPKIFIGQRRASRGFRRWYWLAEKHLEYKRRIWTWHCRTRPHRSITASFEMP